MEIFLEHVKMTTEKTILRLQPSKTGRWSGELLVLLAYVASIERQNLIPYIVRIMVVLPNDPKLKAVISILGNMNLHLDQRRVTIFMY